MSISSEIDRLYGVRQSLITAIEDKGVTVPTGSMLADLIPLIGQLGNVSIRYVYPTEGLWVVDQDGNKGFRIPLASDATPWNGNYMNRQNIAILAESMDFSDSTQGVVQFMEYDTGTEEILGISYRTVRIGNLVWLGENLRSEDENIPLGDETEWTTPARWYPNDDQTTVERHGYLYNGYAMQYIDQTLLLDSDWRVPTETDWENLAICVDGEKDTYDSQVYTSDYNTRGMGGPSAGVKLKGGSEWRGSLSMSLASVVPNLYLDTFGMCILPSGERKSNTISNFGNATTLWCKTANSKNEFLNPWLDKRTNKGSSNDPYVARYACTSMFKGNNAIGNAYSIRLVKSIG